MGTELNDDDATAFALEWQVRNTEPMLFKEARFPQCPSACTPPKKMMKVRLGMSEAKREAEKACANWGEDKEECVFDVIATRDVMIAGEGRIIDAEWVSNQPHLVANDNKKVFQSSSP